MLTDRLDHQALPQFTGPGLAFCCHRPLSSNVRFSHSANIHKPTMRETQMATKPTPKPSTPMTKQASSRIQSATAKSNGGAVPKGSFSARAQSTVAVRPVQVKVTSAPAAKTAARTISASNTGAASKSAAGSALSQVAPKRVTSAPAAAAASKVLRDGRTSTASKSAAGSALAQRPPAKKR